MVTGTHEALQDRPSKEFPLPLASEKTILPGIGWSVQYSRTVVDYGQTVRTLYGSVDDLPKASNLKKSYIQWVRKRTRSRRIISNLSLQK